MKRFLETKFFFLIKETSPSGFDVLILEDEYIKKALLLIDTQKELTCHLLKAELNEYHYLSIINVSSGNNYYCSNAGVLSSKDKHSNRILHLIHYF
jgi:hypothetical protein